jgi:hypothetical protein
MTLIPEPQTMGSETDVARLEQQLEDLSAQYLQQFGEASLDDGKLVATIAKLYSGAKRLHEAVKEGAVVDAIVEMGANLIGCEQMAVMVARGEPNKVAFIGSVGLSRRQLHSMRMNGRAIIEEAGIGAVYMANDGEEPDPRLSSLGIVAFVPFSLDCTTKGGIVLFDLLPQREGLDSSDRELLKLLCAYVGPCLSTDKGKGQETSDKGKGQETSDKGQGEETLDKRKDQETSDKAKGQETSDTGKGQETSNKRKDQESWG